MPQIVPSVITLCSYAAINAPNACGVNCGANHVDEGRLPGMTRHGGSEASSVPNASASAWANMFATSRS